MSGKTQDKPKIRQQDVWQGRYRDIAFKINLHAKDASYTPGGEGIWCYYVFIPEQKAGHFESLWLPDKLVKWGENSPERVTHDYYASGFPSIEMHGGITYYAKHGHTDGHRCVEVGCDYNHLWDMERGGGYTVDEILHDVQQTIDALWDGAILKEEVMP